MGSGMPILVKVGDRQPVAATSDGGRDERMNLTTRVDVKAIVDIWKGISFEGMGFIPK